MASTFSKFFSRTGSVKFARYNTNNAHTFSYFVSKLQHILTDIHDVLLVYTLFS